MRALSLLFLLFLAGCATFSVRMDTVRTMVQQGQYDPAIASLKEAAEKKDNDELLYLMELGMVLHRAGRYEEAVQAFLKADKIADIVDYTSISQEALSVVLSDEVKPYKGEHFEKLLINVYLAIDFTLLRKWDEALVECRKVNHKLDRMIREGGMPYEQNAFAKYLAAALFEARHEWNDALVDYRTVLKWKSDFPLLGPPLLRLSDKLKMEQEKEEFEKKFPKPGKYRLGKGEGEIVFIVEQGRAPVKVPSQQFHLVPKFQRSYYTSDYVRLKVGEQRVRTYPLFDIEQTAIAELDHRIAGIVAKKVAGVVAKEVIAAQVEKATKSEAAGLLTRLLLHASDIADLRSWQLLPARLQIARVIVPAGKHEIVVDQVAVSGASAQSAQRISVEVKGGQISFVNLRTQDW